MANKTLKHKQVLVPKQQKIHVGEETDADSPRFFHREAVDSQNPAKGVLSAVDDVLLVLVVQLPLHDVATQVEHDLEGRGRTSLTDRIMSRITNQQV